MTPTHFKKTLLVEDEGLTRQALKSLMLQSAPTLEIDEASDVDSCKASLGRGGYELLFLDYHLGGASTGLDVLRWLAEREIGVQTVMLSNHDDRETVLECIKMGAVGFISKRTERGADVFRAALDTIMQGQIYLPNSALGRGGYSPAPLAGAKPVSLDSLGLSPRLVETLAYICQGLPNKAIARHMNLAESTVKEYSSDLLEKFGVRRRAELIVEMARRGLVIPRS